MSAQFQNNSSLYLSQNHLSVPQTPALSVNMVHTPYSCEHDLVPTGSEAVSQFGTSLPESENTYNSASNSQQGMIAHGSNGSFGPNTTVNSTVASATKIGRRSINSSTVSPQPSFDPWTSSSNNAATHSMEYTNSSSNIMASEDQNNQNFPAFMMRAPICNAPVHSGHLGGKAEYLEIPTQGAEITTAAQWNRQFKVFIGHVKFEINAEGLRWLIYMLTGVQAGKIEVRGMGCFMAFFASADDVFRVRGLHKRVLFDVNGVWFAQNQAQENLLHTYANTVAPTVHAKLPKGLMVVDEETSRRRPKKSKKSNSVVAPTTSVTVAAGPIAVGASPMVQQQVAGGFQSHAMLQPAAHCPQQSAADMWAAQGNNEEDEYCS